MLGNHSKSFFKQDKNSIKVSKYLLYIREKVITLKNDLDGINIYRADNEKIKLKEKNIENNLKKMNFFYKISKLLRNKISHTMSKKYYQRLKDKVIK